jgi:hypothetical protein
MPKRLAIDDIKLFLDSINYKLLSDYYKNADTPIIVQCDKGHIYQTTYHNLKRGYRCAKCSGYGKYSYEEVKHFIEVESNSGCSLLSSSKDYKTATSNIKIQCSCGNIFTTTFSYFKHENKRQCNKCGERIRTSWKRHDYEYIKNFIEVESGSKCKLISKDYVNSATPLIIQCKEGHIFEKRFNDFQDGSWCPICSNILKGENSKHEYEYVKSKIEEVKGYKLLSNKYINTKTKLKIMCPHGHIFNMSFDCFIYANQRCPICNESKGEVLIRNYLETNNISFEPQYTFKDCRGKKRPLLFDFAVFEDKSKTKLKCLIEYDGQQHFEIIEYFGEESFKNTQKYDKIKNKYCKNNNIKLIRIPYWEFDNIEVILQKEII